MRSHFPDGEGLFETILTIHGSPQLLELHLARASKSAALLGWNFPTRTEVASQVNVVLSRFPVETNLGRLRLVFFPDGSCEASHDSYTRGSEPARLAISTVAVDESSPLAGFKSLPYRQNLEILSLAKQQGSDDAVRFNTRGEVAETAVANLLLKIDDRWFTPPVSAGILPGIVRSLALERLPIEERTFHAQDLGNVESIFLVNSLKGFQAVSSVDGRPLHIDTSFLEKIASWPEFGSVE